MHLTVIIFLARRYAGAVLDVIVCPSVCLSVCPAVTRRYCVKTAKSIMQTNAT